MKKIQFIQNDLIDFENTLKSTLIPIKPDHSFVGSLQSRLQESTILYKQERLAYILLAIAGGLLTGLVIFLIGRGFLGKPKER